MFFFNKRKERNEAIEKLKAITKVLESSQRGIYKRIDENRELLELLKKESPELIEKCFWIEGWIDSQDQFLTNLSEVSGVKNHLAEFNERKYPRPFPKK